MRAFAKIPLQMLILLTGVGITTNDTVRRDYTIEADPNVNGGAGSSFDFGVNFGNGAGPPGNGTLSSVDFTVFADQALTLAPLAELSQAKGGMIDLHLLLHVQGTSLVPGANSEAVGGTLVYLPEPSSGVLLSLGLMTGLALERRRRSG